MKKFLVALLLCGALTNFVHSEEIGGIDTLKDVDISQVRCALEERLVDIDAALTYFEGDERSLLEGGKKNIVEVIEQLNELEDDRGIICAMHDAKEKVAQKLQEWKERLFQMRKRTLLYVGGALLIAGVCAYFLVKAVRGHRDLKTDRVRQDARIDTQLTTIAKLNDIIDTKGTGAVAAYEAKLAQAGVDHDAARAELVRDLAAARAACTATAANLANRGTEGAQLQTQIDALKATEANLRRLLGTKENEVTGLTAALGTKTGEFGALNTRMNAIKAAYVPLLTKNTEFDVLTRGRRGSPAHKARQDWRNDIRGLVVGLDVHINPS